MDTTAEFTAAEVAHIELMTAALLRAEPAIAAGADPFEATGHMDDSPPHLAGLATISDCPHLLAAMVDKHGVAVNSTNGTPHLLLCGAAANGAVKCVAALLARGAHVDGRPPGDQDAVTPLYGAAQCGSVAVGRLLLDAGADTKFRCRLGFTPMAAAAEGGHAGFVMLLLQRGADACAKNIQMRPPIFLACRRQHVLAVKALLPHAELTHFDKSELSLLHLAAIHGGPAILEAILPRYVEADLIDIASRTRATPLWLALGSSRYAEAKMLLQAGASRYVKSHLGENILFSCVASQSPACMELLLGSAPDWHFTPQQLNEGDDQGVTVLGFAVIASANASICIAMAKLLIAAGASPLKAHMDETCYEAARRRFPGHPEVLALFSSSTPLRVPLAPQRCANCGTNDVKLRACAKCHAVRYCSTTCQRGHWAQHKSTCLSPEDARQALYARARAVLDN
jgi:MYND finger/Ankyrin repeats (3 copies)